MAARRTVARVTFSWTTSDVALYHLAVGAAADPMDAAGLASSTTPRPRCCRRSPRSPPTSTPKVSFPGVDIDLARSCTATAGHRTDPCPRRVRRPRTTIARLRNKGSAAVIDAGGGDRRRERRDPVTTRSSIFAKGEGGSAVSAGASAKVELPDRTPTTRSCAHQTPTTGTALPPARRPRNPRTRIRDSPRRRFRPPDPAACVPTAASPAPSSTTCSTVM